MRLHFLDIHTSAKASASGADQYAMRLRVVPCGGDQRGQRVPAGTVQRVDWGVVQDDFGYSTVLLYQDRH
jgi:hypothetical protein